MYLYGTVQTYAAAASSGSPTPGGGSVAALAGALGTTMAAMAANFTVGKKKFESVEPEVRERLAACLRARDELLRLMDEDTRAYATVSAAYALPKETPEEKKARSAAIQAALVTAMDAPLRVVRECRAVMAPIVRLAEIANPNLLSDVGVAAILAEAALRAAKLNVEVNLKELKDAKLVAGVRAEIEAAAREASAAAAGVMAGVDRAIGAGG
jgi:glutamate formiminotransferase/formiminotetrahydrofolate cyclodeaminase